MLLASGGPLWQENLEGICEGKGCWRTLQGGGTHTWHSLTHAACWGVVADTCCSPKAHLGSDSERANFHSLKPTKL